MKRQEGPRGLNAHEDGEAKETTQRPDFMDKLEQLYPVNRGLPYPECKSGQPIIAPPVVKHYVGMDNPLIKFDSDEWGIEGDRDDAEALADSINRLRGQVHTEQLAVNYWANEVKALRQRLLNVEYERDGWMKEAGKEKEARIEAENNAKQSHSETIRLRGFLEANRRSKK